MNKKKYSHILIIVLFDCLIIPLSGIVAMMVRFDFNFGMIPYTWINRLIFNIPLEIGITIIAFGIFKLYHFVWHFIGLNDVVKMVIVITGLEIVYISVSYVFGFYLPKSVAFINYVIKLLLFVALRCSVRVFNLVRIKSGENTKERIMIIGAGEAGNLILKEIELNRSEYGKVCCIIDDNPIKRGKSLLGVPIIGGRDEIVNAYHKYEITTIILAIPTISNSEKKELLNICKETGANVKILPGITQIYNGEVGVKELKDVEIEDLLGRDPIELDNESVKLFVSQKVVLVTGGGGSIGSELCRQIASYGPEKLIIVDIYENSTYEIQQELVRKYKNDLDLHVEIASVRDAFSMKNIFEKYRPEIVFHAAAHKHVPLMESAPQEAIKNNIFGTYNVVCAAEEVGVKKFVMISTDKAVNPTNVMGATKRFCEMIVQSRKSETEFACVRFGNVLGSNGSVVPLFKKQIAQGGPVTITDKRITRFFMTIPEAVQLVLQAGAMAKKNQVFVLDMGEPVKILDMAENLIKLSGLKPYKDIEIKEIGLRPGEKLFEELLMNNDKLIKTSNSKIFVDTQSGLQFDEMNDKLAFLHSCLNNSSSEGGLREALKAVVPTYKSPEEINNGVM